MLVVFEYGVECFELQAIVDNVVCSVQTDVEKPHPVTDLLRSFTDAKTTTVRVLQTRHFVTVDAANGEPAGGRSKFKPRHATLFSTLA